MVDLVLAQVRPFREQFRRPDFLSGAIHDVRILRPVPDGLAEHRDGDTIRRLFEQLASEAFADAVAHIGELIDPEVIHQTNLVLSETAPGIIDGERARTLAAIGIALVHGNAAEVVLESLHRVDHGARPIADARVQSTSRCHQQRKTAADLLVTNADVASLVMRHGTLPHLASGAPTRAALS